MVQTGVYTKTDIKGDGIYLQAKYFDDHGNLKDTVRPDIYIDNRLQKHVLNEGDILFVAKGIKNIATVYNSNIGKAVASSSFFVIKLFPDIKQILLPDFLAWVMNNPEKQKILKAQAKGSALPSITIITIQNFCLFIPPIEKQKTILNIDKLRIKEKQLTSQIQNLKEEFLLKSLIRDL